MPQRHPSARFVEASAPPRLVSARRGRRDGRLRIYYACQFLLGMFVNVLRLISFMTFRLLFFRLTTEGVENLRVCAGPLIVVGNHKSFFDPLFMMVPVIRHHIGLLPARSIGADWLFRVPVLGWGLKNLFGAYPAQKGQGLEKSLGGLFRALEKNMVVGLYPEGGIRYRPGVHGVQVGAAYLARKSGAPILPIALRGIDYLSWRAFFFGRRTVTVVFGELLYVSPDEDVRCASEKIRSAIDALYRA